jgi:hypothetical protein
MAAQPSYGSCSFDVPQSDVAVGDWSVTLTATSGSATGSSNFKVTLQ